MDDLLHLLNRSRPNNTTYEWEKDKSLQHILHAAVSN